MRVPSEQKLEKGHSDSDEIDSAQNQDTKFISELVNYMKRNKISINMLTSPDNCKDEALPEEIVGKKST